MMANQKETSKVSSTRAIALVTGANQGVGYQVAKALAENGYLVLVGSRNIDKGHAAAENIGLDTQSIQLDVTDQSSIAAAAEHIRKEFGRLDLLVNNAGISHAGKPGRSLEEMMDSGLASKASLDEVRAVWETNVFGIIGVTQAMLPLIRQSAAGRIVNVSSSFGSLTWISDPTSFARAQFGVVYAASKTAVNAVTLAFAVELGKEHIKVNAVSPGFTATALNNFEGVDSVEEGSRAPIRVALETDGPTGTFSGPEGPLPW
jgi:NAD(P)-dependent dehydrogenase (short-subunit alcohol dehydrogenase family)